MCGPEPAREGGAGEAATCRTEPARAGGAGEAVTCGTEPARAGGTGEAVTCGTELAGEGAAGDAAMCGTELAGEGEAADTATGGTGTSTSKASHGGVSGAGSSCSPGETSPVTSWEALSGAAPRSCGAAGGSGSPMDGKGLPPGRGVIWSMASALGACAGTGFGIGM
ncbi:hypothetical protein [Novosphingobium profundi]|uniref:hypothetical protein n=1 Tax=Novosphingobium profundi TaxID=1774954 RepID=UPI001CFEEACA|nr:hypothetical protein [Novosphingobium profundi]